MKNLLPYILCILFFSCQTQFSESPNIVEEDKAVPNEWFYAQRAFPQGKIDKRAYHEALRYRQDLIQNQSTESYTEVWEFKGPTNIGGRVSDLEIPSNTSGTIYVGTASGGIFKTENTGDTWVPIFDDAMSLSIGDMELAPSNNDIIYVGTGESNAGGGSLAYDGVGVYRSDDGGNSWQYLGLENIGSVGKIEVAYDESNVAYVAAMGDLFGDNSERGVYKTTDGGGTWNQVLFISDSTGVVDLAMHPTNSNIIFAAAWERIRRPDRRRYTGASSGIYRTIDGGDNWELLTNGLPTQANDKGRIGLAISPSDPNYVYAYIVNEGGTLTGIYQTTNGGDNWSSVTKNGIGEPPFMWWFGKIYVHPESPNSLFALSLDVHYIEDITSSNFWETRFAGAHVDQHAIAIHPQNPDWVVAGNDGGVYLSEDRGVNFEKLNGLPITQFYRATLDFQFPERLYGGTQDNGTNRTLTGNLDDWVRIFGGDGFFTLVNPVDNNFVYAEFQNGNLARSLDGGFSFSSSMAGFQSTRRNWNSPVVFDPNDPSILYMGGNRLNKTTNHAGSWESISPDLTDGPGGGNLTFGTITTISVSPIDGDIIMVGTDDGNVSITIDGGDNWNNVSDGLPKFWVTRVHLDPTELGVAYATISGFRYNEETTHVFKTLDNGSTWIPISGDLPNIPVNDIVVNPINHDLYIATDIGVFISKNDGDSWELLGTGLPNVVITDLTYHEPTATLLAATYGRSLFTVEVDIDVSVNELAQNGLDVSVFPNPFAENSNITITNEGFQYLEIQVFDLNGRLIENIFSGNLSLGEHVFSFGKKEWDSGFYFLQIKNEDGVILRNEKLVKG